MVLVTCNSFPLIILRLIKITFKKLYAYANLQSSVVMTNLEKVPNLPKSWVSVKLRTSIIYSLINHTSLTEN